MACSILFLDSSVFGSCRLYLSKKYRALQKLWRSAWLEWQIRQHLIRERPLLAKARRQASGLDFNPLVSITIPTYNRGKLLTERTIPSVLAQTHKNFEIVIVGDHCTDDTEARIHRIGDPRIRFENLAARGNYPEDPILCWMVAGAVPLNEAIHLARGDWIACLDDDDVFEPHHLEAMLSVAKQTQSELVFGRMAMEKSAGVWHEIGGPGFPTGRWPFVNKCPHSTVLYRSYLRLFRYDVESWKYRISADNQLWQRMARSGVKATFVDRVTAKAPQRPQTP